jgi:protein O-GlcNAc transferase
VSQLAVGLFEAHDRKRFEVSAFSFGPDDGSALRHRVVGAFEHFYEVAGEPDHDVARRIKEVGIDILIDLKGYTFEARPGILAQRAAPLQVSFLGYPGTLGATWMDYLIADRVTVPQELRAHYAEALVLLPKSYLVSDSARPRPVPLPRDAVGLPPATFVFACFNACYKLNPPLFEVWMRLLAAVPGSILWLRESTQEVCGRLRAEAAARGIAPERIAFAPRTEYAAHLARQSHADLFLDTFPYNAHTTASEALWMGLPVLTVAGESFASRVASSLLCALGVSELVTRNVAEYESRALELARDPARLAALRARILAARESSGVFDSADFCRSFERALESIWARHERGERPATLLPADEN